MGASDKHHKPFPSLSPPQLNPEGLPRPEACQAVLTCEALSGALRGASTSPGRMRMVPTGRGAMLLISRPPESEREIDSEGRGDRE